MLISSCSLGLRHDRETCKVGKTLDMLIKNFTLSGIHVITRK